MGSSTHPLSQRDVHFTAELGAEAMRLACATQIEPADGAKRDNCTVLLLISSAAGYERRRDVVRRTYLSLLDPASTTSPLSAELRASVKYRFLLGAPEPAQAAALAAEQAEHGDLLQVAVPESYETLFPKLVASWRWGNAPTNSSTSCTPTTTRSCASRSCSRGSRRTRRARPSARRGCTPGTSGTGRRGGGRSRCATRRRSRTCPSSSGPTTRTRRLRRAAASSSRTSSSTHSRAAPTASSTAASSTCPSASRSRSTSRPRRSSTCPRCGRTGRCRSTSRTRSSSITCSRRSSASSSTRAYGAPPSAEEQAADARIAAVYDMFVGAKVLRR